MPKTIIKLGICLVFLVVTCNTLATKNTALYKSIVSNEQRPEQDLNFDEARKPVEILPFTHIKPGDRILELGAGGGYSTELFSLLVGERGKVYAHFLYNKDRLRDNRLSNVVDLRQHHLDELSSVLDDVQLDRNSLDAVAIFFILHDIYLNNEMSDGLIKTLFERLKPGGSLVILDNAAVPGSELEAIGTLHRIDEQFVKNVFLNAGFVLDGETDVLRNTDDDRTQPWGPFQGFQDRFALRFKKPQ